MSVVKTCLEEGDRWWENKRQSTEPDWTGPDQTGPNWTAPNWTEPDWTGPDWTGPSPAGHEQKQKLLLNKDGL